MPTWQELLDHKYSLKFIVNEVCRNIKVLNGKSDDTLDYDNFVNENDFGLHTIIIGGDKLSRGITLEGLSTSYFLRSAKIEKARNVEPVPKNVNSKIHANNEFSNGLCNAKANGIDA